LHGSRTAIGVVAIIFLLFGMNVTVMDPGEGSASAWNNGNPLSEAYPNYGIHDIIANMSVYLLKEKNPLKAQYIDYWFLPDGADSEPFSFQEGRTIPGPNDNFLAYNDDAPEGDAENYFVNNRKGWEDTDAAQEIQKYVNRTVQNLTAWMLVGMPNGSVNHHKAVYNLGLLSHYMGDMSQFGHTDYSKWDQATHPSGFDPYDVTYQLYYEQYIWDDERMNELIDDFGLRTFNVPDVPDAEDIHVRVSEVAKWVNGRGQAPVQIADRDSSTITVGANYRYMLETFRNNWDTAKDYKGARGFDEALWNLTVENLISATENLTAFYISIWNKAWSNFLALSADLSVVSYTQVPVDVIAGDRVTVTAKVRNNGPRDSGIFNCGLFAKGALVPDDPLEDRFLDLKPVNVPAHSEVNVTFFPIPTKLHPVNVTLRADWLQQVNEANEDDNTLNFSFMPIPEDHRSHLSLGEPFPDIRQDTSKLVQIDVINDGNRFDLFTINASTTSQGLDVEPQIAPVGVLPGGTGRATVTITSAPGAPLGSAGIRIIAEGVNSTSTIDVTFTVLERTGDPTPVVTGEMWARSEEVFTLSASESTDPDGDSLTFRWSIPDKGDFEGPVVTFNYTRPGEYGITLIIFDGNVTVLRTYTVTVYPKVPENLSAEVSSIGTSTVTISWKEWPSGGLLGYWLRAEAVDGQGERSEGGPYFSWFGPGNRSGPIGRFLPGTQVVISMGVDAERYGNRTLQTISATTYGTKTYKDQATLKIDNYYLYVRYKPWLESVSQREPVLVVERMYAGAFVPIGSDPTIMATTPLQDTIRYPVGANSGTYRASFTYRWTDGGSAFTVENSTTIANMVPSIALIGTSSLWEQDINGTARVRLQLSIDDPEDTLTILVDWGDGISETYEDIAVPNLDIFHNFTQMGKYEVRMIGTDWSGDRAYRNTTLTVVEYSFNITKDKDPNLVLKIVLAVIGGIFLVAILAFFGYTGYKFAKKETQVDFDREKMKGRMDLKPGTGTDFDQRRDMQIPKESIMRIEEPKTKESEPSVKQTPMKSSTVISGTITFDEE